MLGKDSNGRRGGERSFPTVASKVSSRRPSLTEAIKARSPPPVSDGSLRMPKNNPISSGLPDQPSAASADARSNSFAQREKIFLSRRRVKMSLIDGSAQRPPRCTGPESRTLNALRPAARPSSKEAKPSPQGVTRPTAVTEAFNPKPTPPQSHWILQSQRHC
jgi:hypothetical protein